MSDLKKLITDFQAKVADAQSEEDARKIFEEIKPQLSELTDLFFRDTDKTDEEIEKEIEEIDWIGELQAYIVETIRLYLAYYVKGTLKHINLTLTEKCPPVIMLTINKMEYVIDFEEIKNGTDKRNRDAHRECYYRNESIWHDFRNWNPSIDLPTAGNDLCKRLSSSFPSAPTNYSIKG